MTRGNSGTVRQREFAYEGANGRGAPKYAFRGLLPCEVCGSSFVNIGGTNALRAYGCSRNRFGGAGFTNGIRVRQSLLEARLCTPIKNELLQADMREEIAR